LGITSGPCTPERLLPNLFDSELDSEDFCQRNKKARHKCLARKELQLFVFLGEIPGHSRRKAV
jgi:hypothetical protein